MNNTPCHPYNLRTIFDSWRNILIMRAENRHPCAKIIKEAQGLMHPRVKRNFDPSYGMLWTIRFERLTASDHIPKTIALIKAELRTLGGRLTGNKPELTATLIKARWRKRDGDNNKWIWDKKMARRNCDELWYRVEKMGEV